MNTEDEHGTYVRSPQRHNGYYAGDFSHHPFPTGRDLRLLVGERVRSTVGTSW